MSRPDTPRLHRTIPRPVRFEVPRTTLLADLLPGETPLTCLLAPAGYGKTTLLSQLARHSAGRSVWLSLREDDADPLILCQHLQAAVQDVLPTLPLAASARAAEVGGTPSTFADALALDLTRSTTNLNLFLDGTDLLRPASEQWLNHLLDHLGEGHRLFLAGRTEPHLRLPQRVASGEARTLGPTELAFTRTETASLLEAAQPGATQAGVHERLEGWPIGINLAASTAGGTLPPGHLFDELLSNLPPDLQAALPALSVLDVWTATSPAQLNLRCPPDWLRLLRAAGLPLIPLDSAYRPHQLLRDYLDDALRLQGQQYPKLHALAGTQAEQAGELWLALHHYRLANDHAAHLRLAEHLARRYEQRWELRLVRQVLETLPPDQLPAHLKPLFGHALVEAGDPVRGETLLREQYAAGDRSPALLFSLGAVEARLGHGEQQLELALQGLSLAPVGREHSRLHRLKASALLNLNRSQEAVQAAQEALEVARAEVDQSEVAAALTVLQGTYRQSDDLIACEAALRWALQLYADLGMPTRAVLLQNELADLLRVKGQPQEALEIIQTALPIAVAEQSVVEVLLLETQADLYFDLGTYQQAMTTYQQAIRRAIHFNIKSLHLRMLPHLTECALLDRQFTEAAQATALLNLLGGPEHAANQHFCQGLCAHHQGHWLEAHQAFSGASAAAPELAFRAPLYAAFAALQLRQWTAQDAHTLNRHIEQTHGKFPLQDRPLLERLSAEAQQFGVPTQTLAKALPVSLTQSPQAGTRLHLRLLGDLSVSLDEQPVHLPLQRCAELLAYLALQGPSTRDAILDDLWNGSREQRHIEYFKVALRHLRLALGSARTLSFNPVPFNEGRYRLAPEFTLSSDVQALQDSFTDQHPEGQEQAFQQVTGPLLPESESDWADLTRTRLLDQALALGLTLARRHAATDPARAATYYERCLELDPLHEDCHLALIHLWAAQQASGPARRCFERYRRMLQQEWNRTPDPALNTLLSAIPP